MEGSLIIKPQRTLLILGMHRSGTSVLAQFIIELGIDLGSDLLSGSIGNRNGHFEDVEFLNLHEKIIIRETGKSGGLSGQEINLSVQDREEAKELIRKKSGSNNQWGWKEPRTCLFIDLYSDLLNGSMRSLIVVRDPLEVVNSLINRELKIFEARYCNRSVLHKLRYRLQKSKLTNRVISSNLNNYLQSWVQYNTAILNFVKNTDQDNFLVLAHDTLPAKGEIIKRALKNWGIKYQEAKMERIFDASQTRKEQFPASEELDRKNLKQAYDIYNSLIAMAI